MDTENNKNIDGNIEEENVCNCKNEENNVEQNVEQNDEEKYEQKNVQNTTNEAEQKNEQDTENQNLENEEQNESKTNESTIEKTEDEILKEKVKEAEDKYVRLFAEFQNFRNRTDKEKTDMYDIGVSSALLKMLPIVDNIERALCNVPEEIKTNPFVDGIDKVYKQIQKLFEEMDVKVIEAKGKTFDANLHNAVMTDENSQAEVDTITEELLKGYMYKEQVLRHSMVKVKK